MSNEDEVMPSLKKDEIGSRPRSRERRLYALSRKYARQFAVVFAVQFSGTD